MTDTKRLSFIDVAKGLLILIVVIHHTPHVVRILGYDDIVYQTVDSYSYWYVTFFMPAFFVITGYCTKIKVGQKLWQIVLRNAKTIILPGFAIGALFSWQRHIFAGSVNPIDYMKIGWGGLIKNGGPFWFLSALFVAKVIYWTCERYITCKRCEFIKPLCYLALVVLGCFMNDLGVKEIWWMWHAFALCIFLYIGRLLRERGFSNRLCIVCAFLFIASILILKGLDIRTAYITMGIRTHVYEIPIFLWLSTTGTIMILGISRWIASCKMLEFFGRSSLIIYCLHVRYLFIIFGHGLGNHVEQSVTISILTFIFVIPFVVALMSLSIWILNLKYVRVLIGKFETRYF